jgi:hypothetical protein
MTTKSYILDYSWGFYEVQINDDEINIYANYKINKHNELTKTIKSYSKVIFYDDDFDDCEGDCDNAPFYGDCILIKINDKKYTYIGNSIIYDFETTDEIVELMYQDKNCYYAVGTKFVYLLNEQVYVKKSKLGDSIPYDFYIYYPDIFHSLEIYNLEW